MNFEPQKFFIGIIDFFSVLLPGALITYLAKDELGPMVLGSDFSKLEATNAWIAFLFSSYLLGHFIFLIGSLLDKKYDDIRTATEGQQARRVAEGKKPASALEKFLAQRFFRKDPDLPLNHVIAIRDRCVPKANGKAPMNAFQWAKARLTMEQPAALATVQRFEADSKFFRSLVIVLAVVILWNAIKGAWSNALLCLVPMGFAFWRYADQRYKATDQAYWYIITLDGNRPADTRNEGRVQHESEQQGRWETKVLPSRHDYSAPDASEIRLLPKLKGGGLCQCTLPPQGVSRAVRHKTVEEVWYCLEGHGQLWRKYGNEEETVDLHPGTAATIPPDTHFQFRNTFSAPLHILIATMPPWPGEGEAVLVPDHWPTTGEKQGS